MDGCRFVIASCIVKYSIAMKLFIFVVLVSSHLLVEAKYVPSSSKAGECSPEPDDCIAKINSVRQDGDNLIVRYTASTCPGTTSEEIQFQIGEGALGGEVNLVEGIAVIYNLGNICEKVTIVLTTKSEMGTDCDRSEVSTKLLPVKMEKVTPVDNDKILVSWTYPDLPEGCEVNYRIHYVDSDGSSSENEECIDPPNCELDISKIAYCEDFDIFVTPYIDDPAEESRAKISYTRPLPSVAEATIVPDSTGSIIAAFTPLAVLGEKCGEVHYQIKQVDGECYSSEISVQVVAVNGDKNVVTTSEPKTINRGPGRVVNPTYELIGDQVKLSWFDNNDENCPLWYSIKYNDGSIDKVVTTHLTTATVRNLATVCTTNDITLNANHDSTPGIETIVPVEGAFGWVEIVCGDVSAGATKVTCSWKDDKLGNTLDCEISYMVTYSTGKGLPGTMDTDEKTYEFDLEGCETEVWIQVTPTTKAPNWEEDRVGTTMDKVVNVPDCDSKVPSTWW